MTGNDKLIGCTSDRAAFVTETGHFTVEEVDGYVSSVLKDRCLSFHAYRAGSDPRHVPAPVTLIISGDRNLKLIRDKINALLELEGNSRSIL